MILAIVKTNSRVIDVPTSRCLSAMVHPGSLAASQVEKYVSDILQVLVRSQ